VVGREMRFIDDEDEVGWEEWIEMLDASEGDVKGV